MHRDSTMRMTVSLGGAIIILALLAGCGGGAILGSLIGFGTLVDNVGDFIEDEFGGDVHPDDFEVLLDGYPVGTRPSSSGELRLDVLPTGYHLLSVVTDDRKRGFHHAMEITEDQNNLPLGDITPIEASAISGTVERETTTQGTAAVATAPVVAILDGAQLLQSPTGAAITIPPKNPGLTWAMGFTDENGDYRIGPCESGDWLVIAGLPGFYADALIVTVQRPNDASDQDLFMEGMQGAQTATIAGTVTGDGRGLTDALVYTDLTAAFEGQVSQQTENEVEGSAGFDLIGSPWFNFARYATITTNAATYSLKSAPGSQSVTAFKENYSVGRRQVAPQAGQGLNIDFDLDGI